MKCAVNAVLIVGISTRIPPRGTLLIENEKPMTLFMVALYGLLTALAPPLLFKSKPIPPPQMAE